MSKNELKDLELEAMAVLISTLRPLDLTARLRVLTMAAIMLGLVSESLQSEILAKAVSR